MSQHRHREYVEGCFRCDLSRDESQEKDPMVANMFISNHYHATPEETLAQFTALQTRHAKEIRKAKAEAWEEGFDAGEADAHRPINHEECIPNPYKDLP